MLLDVIVPTFHKKFDIVCETTKHNTSILDSLGVEYRYIIVVDLHADVDSTLNYAKLNSLSPNVNMYFSMNSTGHKESFRCINLGFHLSKAPAVLILDDDYLISKAYILALQNFDAPAIFVNSYLANGERHEISMNPYDEAMTIGSGPPKYIRRHVVEYVGLYDSRYIGYMYCDNDFSRRYGGLPGTIVLDGADLGIAVKDHPHYYGTRLVPKDKLHDMYKDRNYKLFLSAAKGVS